MAGVIDGQAVNAAITNAAFLYKNGDDTMPFNLALAATSSGSITNLQNTINVLISGLGGTQSTPATAYSGAPTGTIVNGDDHVESLVRLAQLFYGLAASGGHTHDGTDGEGPQIEYINLIGGNEIQEIPSGTINGINTVFTLSETPATDASVKLYRNGIFMRQGASGDYTISGPTLTMTTAPATTQTLDAVYRY